MVTDIQRENLFWQLSTGIKTEWGFDSDTAGGLSCEVLPMLGIDYLMPLSSTNTAPAGRYHFTVVPDARNGRDAADRQAERRPLVGRRPDLASADDQCGDTSCKAHVRNRAGGHASLRVSATDTAGRTVTQEVIRAYAVRR